ncbi:mandelate racemase/muconate lactonizing enzyme family protein [Amycolatopsis sp. NPDC047767]|uniref:mandelate racemase/muconate lactonizing enzyme family protein n=1 Tax=Amycolatopsis sp. NPDC047767 TaxID=3156765 RepID=UPI003455C7F7
MGSAPLTITDVRAVVVPRVRMGEGLTAPWDRKTHFTREYVAVRVDTDAGFQGITLDGEWDSVVMTPEVVREQIAPELIGRSVFDLVHHTRVLGSVRAPGRYHFIEIALWDIIGQALGQPLAQLWGGREAGVLAYASTVHYGKTPEERAEDCKHYRARGYRAVKLRLSEDTIDGDLALVAACREAVGDDLDILVDANQAGRDPADPHTWSLQRALDTARELAALKVGWLEEPLPYRMADEGRQLAARAPLPIAGGEGKSGLAPFWEVLHQGVYTVVQPDPVHSGTPTTLLQILNLAEAANVPIAFHHGKSGVGMLLALHLQAAFGLGVHLEVMDDPGHWNPEGFQVGFREPVLPGPDGIVPVPDRPGLGADWDERWLDEVFGS